MDTYLKSLVNEVCSYWHAVYGIAAIAIRTDIAAPICASGSMPTMT